MIAYGRQCIDQDDIDAVVATLKSDFLTQGPQVPAFETMLAEYCGARRAVAVSSATSALHIACLALGVGPGDLVWTSPITFVASANCALYCGAEIDFVDIDPRSYNMCVDALEAKLAAAERQWRLPKVVIPVHLAGQSCNMLRIRELGDRYGFAIIEDASHAVGARYLGEPVGSCRYSDITIFSFHPVKIITTAEGGLALTNDHGLAQRMELLRTHGISRDRALLQGGHDEGWYYEQVALGFNYRMTELQAALGRSQATRLDRFVARRRELAAVYDDAFVEENLVPPWRDPQAVSSFHLYIIRVSDDSGEGRRRVYDALHSGGVGANVHYIPVYLQPFYRGLGFAAGMCPQAETYYRTALSIPLHPSIDADDQAVVIEAVRKAVRN